VPGGRLSRHVAAHVQIAQARDDATNALQIGLSLYDALEWVYGPGAFGLRLCAWVARKITDDLIDGLTLGTLKLRAVPGAIHSSEKLPVWQGRTDGLETARMAVAARSALQASSQSEADTRRSCRSYYA
jgi:hypothetical protein